MSAIFLYLCRFFIPVGIPLAFKKLRFMLPPLSLGLISTSFISSSLYFLSDISIPNISLKVNSLLFGIISFILESSFISS